MVILRWRHDEVEHVGDAPLHHLAPLRIIRDITSLMSPNATYIFVRKSSAGEIKVQISILDNCASEGELSCDVSSLA